MKIDGVDFWNHNRHIVRIWDHQDRCGPMVVLIDDKVRVNENFGIYFQSDQPGLYRLLQRQAEINNECMMSIVVVDKKSQLDMYHVILRLLLKNVRFGDIDYTNSDPAEIFITYKCLAAEDKTDYDSKTLREIPGESLHDSDESDKLFF